MADKFAQFKWIISDRWFSQIRGVDSGTDILKIVRRPQGPMTELEFKWHLADAILRKRISIEEYERLTDFDFETLEEVAEDLARLWSLLFEDEPITFPIGSESE